MIQALYHKPFPGAAHGDRYRYSIVSETLTEVRWLRSDGLKGRCARSEWDSLYQLAPKTSAPKTSAAVKPAKRKKRD